VRIAPFDASYIELFSGSTETVYAGQTLMLSRLLRRLCPGAWFSMVSRGVIDLVG
jgi:hypothetical protein